MRGADPLTEFAPPATPRDVLKARPAAVAVLTVLLTGLPRPALAQDPDTLDVPPPAAQDVDLPSIESPASPGGAFLRGVLLPGWGHASIGEYTRGGFYFFAESAAAFMLIRTRQRLEAAKGGRDLLEDRLEARVRAEGVTDPEEVSARLEADPFVDDARDLVDARAQQFEDWLALGIFVVFLAGADAFVSAHLADFPEPVRVSARAVHGSAPYTPTGAGAPPSGPAVEVRFIVPVGPGIR